MKTTIQITLVTVVITLMLWFGLQKTIDSRCSYYKQLGITDTQLCGTLNLKNK